MGNASRNVARWNRARQVEGAIALLLLAAPLLLPAQTQPAAPPAQGQTAAQAQTPTEPGAASVSSAASGRISEAQLVGLPLNGRSYSQLATLQAGVSDSSAASASRGVGGGSLTVAGSRPASSNFLLDGTNVQDTENSAPRSAAGVQLGSDAVFQVQVLSNNYGAEYGRSAGGVLNSITRSGSNEFHGTLFHYFRNSKLDARNFFDQGEPPPFKRNQFGFTLTGPLRRDKTYFMGSFEGLRDRLSKTDVSFFPDAAIREGAVDPRVRPYLNLYPIPNDISLGRGVGRNFDSQFLPSDENFFTVRIDHKLGERDSLFGRYTFDDATSVGEGETFLFSTTEKSRQQYLTLTGTHIFSLQVLDAYRFGFTRPVSAVENAMTIDIPQNLYFVDGSPFFGQIQIPGITTFGPNVTYPRTNILNTFQFSNDVIWQRGAQTWKLGGEAHRYRHEVWSEWNKGAVWSFNSLESFLQAGPVGTGVTVAAPGSSNRRSLRQTLLGFYVQNENKITPRWQLNLGLRYEYATEVEDRLGKNVYMEDPIRGTEVRVGRYASENPSGSFSPRVGLTWSQSSSTVLSGGFGIYYDQFLGHIIAQRKSSAPFHNIAVKPNFNASCSGAEATCTFPDAVAAGAGVPFQVQIMDYHNTVLPMVLRYHFTLQQQLGGGARLQASYVGARGNHLFRRFEMNQFPQPEVRSDGTLFFPPQCPAAGSSETPLPNCRAYAGPVNPAFAAMSVTPTDAQSFYNSLQVSLSKPLGGGNSVQGSYTFSKSVDDNSTGVVGNMGQYAWVRTMERGLSDFHLQHRVSANYFYALPFGEGQRWATSGWLSALAGGWRVGGIVSVRSGAPFTASVRLRYRGYLFEALRPNLAPGASNNPVEGDSAGCGQIAAGTELAAPDLYFDPCAFTAPAPGTPGNLGRNTLNAPGVVNMDLSLQRDFLLDSRRRLQFRMDVFNLPNHTNFNRNIGNSVLVFSGENAGRTSTAGRISQTSTTSRQVQFALRLSF
jgi:outer membrane receptor protein involved in Fe transport